ncbi:hypothetical protein [Vibrio crassostreae]|uniref:hypothetical protein n=1 Tax=Vibrio crassostreae TaxID=246167 RepID=UPI001B30EAC5|nr:hypothetical protein [Vibrio crassostreae]
MNTTDKDAIDYVDVINKYKGIAGEEFKYAQYPNYINEAMADTLTVFCVKNDITDKDEIVRLSELIDDTVFNIQTAMMQNKLKEQNNND